MKRIVKVIAIASLLTPALFASNLAACKGCHGAQFEKVAMNVSKVVKDMTKDEIIASLKGYQDGSYGGSMKALMRGQVAGWDDAKIKAAADQIVGK